MAQVLYPGLVPFCITPTDVAPWLIPDANGTVAHSAFYSLGFTQQQLCYWFWKVKTYYFDINITAKSKNSDIPDYYLNISSEVGISSSPPVGAPFLPTTETDFVCFNSIKSQYYFGSIPDNWVFNFYPYYIPAGLNSADYPDCYYYNGLYYPNIYCGAYYYGGIFRYPFNPSGNNYYFPASFLGVSGYVLLGDMTPYENPTGHWIITAGSEWPYNP